MLLEVKHLKKQYEAPGGGKPRVVLEDINLDVKQGEAIAVVGPSGSGKSTLLNIIGTLDKPDEGFLFLEGMNLAEQPPKALSAIRNRKIGFIFQLHHLLPQCTVLENVLIPTIPFKEEKDDHEVELRARDLLAKVGLDKHLDHRPSQLSGGEQQRVAVVRALINKPSLILADEPTGSLDQNTAQNLAQLLIRLNKEENVSLITVTHSGELSKQMQKRYRLVNGTLQRMHDE